MLATVQKKKSCQNKALDLDTNLAAHQKDE